VGGLGEDEGERAGQVSRRKFARTTAKAGLAASAAIWVAPQLSSVALAQTTAGSPPPSTSTTPPGEKPFDPGAAGGTNSAAGGAPQAAGTGAPGARAPGAGGELAFTGSDVRKLAATGGAAVLAGSGLVAAERLSKTRSRPKKAAEGPSDETAR
jgi:hypothetical protein